MYIDLSLVYAFLEKHKVVEFDIKILSLFWMNMMGDCKTNL